MVRYELPRKQRTLLPSVLTPRLFLAYSLVPNEHNEKEGSMDHVRSLLRGWCPGWEESFTQSGSKSTSLSHRNRITGLRGLGPSADSTDIHNDACSSLGHRSNLPFVSCQAVFSFLLDSSGKLKVPMPSRDAAGTLCAKDSVRRFPAWGHYHPWLVSTFILSSQGSMENFSPWQTAEAA